MASAFIFGIRIYQWTLSPLKAALFGSAAGCRFRPTCSAYAIDCLKTLPLSKAIWHSGWRILRCNPWGGSGYDPAPPYVYREAGDRSPAKSLKDELGS